VPELSPKRRELFATFLFNLAVASFAVAAFENRWLGAFMGLACLWGASKISKEL